MTAPSKSVGRQRAAIIAHLGDQQWRAECDAAGRNALRLDYGESKDGFESDAPHKIEELIWDSDLSNRDRIDLCLSVFDDMPCYGHLMYLKHHVAEFTDEERDHLWTEFRARLADPRRANPVAYSLWCDYFEDADIVEEAWAALTEEPVNGAEMRHVLIASGPVPFTLKEPVYARLVGDRAWHPYLYRSLLHSAHDYFGSIDAAKALDWLARLDSPAPVNDVDALRTELQQRLG